MTKRIFGIPQKKLVLGCTIFAVLWYGSFLWAGRPVKLLGAPEAVYGGVDPEQAGIQLHRRTAFYEGELGQAAVQLFVVLNWSQLEKIEGPRELCGEPCSDDSEAVLVRKNVFRNLFGYQKLLFVRIGDIVEYDPADEESFIYPGNFAPCLWDGLAMEIERSRALSVTEGCFGATLRGKSAVHGSRETYQVVENWSFQVGF
ncbi:hypothetical protein [Leisingera sp. JC1]|uniref:hypothetical protein n=1 Tax=Leisingera sp. JC1 TaxID=1855282 RepID=UPI0008038DB7|nr:hypothetical protein [Leisingera sp. JC1]OBY26251.1 hypothetical protein A9D60_19110 [Leisingera sp. JC1]